MTWDEVDEKTGMWTIPAERTKTGAPHIEPLSRQALRILAEAAELGAAR